MISLFKFSVIVLLLIIINSGFCEEKNHSRVKRKLVFNKSMRFFSRINGKDNVIKWNTFIAHGWGFRINFELPDSLPKRHRFFKRDIHNEIENVPTTWGKQGFACMLKYLCEITARIRSSDQCGIFCEIGILIAESTGTDASFLRSLTSNCEKYKEKCPYPFEHMIPTSEV
ncbi:uncharacterized protein [Onthophagus taurus]|uniref:uncharacterized protein n=1 Tax=Onthophagus taurus TaxID=166361 RepID=UPI0039BDC642